MTKTAFLLALIVTALASMPAHAQQTVFVSGQGSDKNPCTTARPCRTFQKAFNTAPANSVIDVLEPGEYGPLNITQGISIQGHGFGGITYTASGLSNAAITVSTSDPVSINGLLLDGVGTGGIGIHITSGQSVQILNSVVRHFTIGIWNVSGASLLIEDTIASDNVTGIVLDDGPSKALLNRITANNNQQIGVQVGVGGATTIANSVISNTTIRGTGSVGLLVFGVTRLAKTVISGNSRGIVENCQVAVPCSNSYGDNYIPDSVEASLTPVGMR